MQTVIGILLLVSFVGLVIYAVRGGNMALGVIIMATLWAGLAILGHYTSSAEFLAANSVAGELTVKDVITNVFQNAFTNNGANTILFFFGAFFGRIMLETGIAQSLIKKTVELGGDRPVVTTVLLTIVVSAIFTSMFGTGAVIAMGVIVLPIVLNLGINKRVALTSFMLAIGAGLYMNNLPFAQYQAYYADGAEYLFNGIYVKYGITAMAVQLLVAIVYVIITSRGNKKVSAWAAPTPTVETKKVPTIALICPILPVIEVIVFDLPICFAFLITALFALIITGKMTSYNDVARIVTKNFADGVVDTAPLLCFMMFIQAFNKAAGLCVPYFNAVLGGIIPKSALVICIVFAVFAPLGLFRGPFTLAGSGAAMLGILSGLGFATPFLYPLFYAPTMTMNISCCITQSWIVWGLNYTDCDTKEYMSHSIPCGWIICIILAIATYVYYGGLAF